MREWGEEQNKIIVMANSGGDSHLKLSKVKDFVSSKFTGRGHHRTPSSSSSKDVPPGTTVALPTTHSEPVLESKPAVNIPLEPNPSMDSVVLNLSKTSQPSASVSSSSAAAPPPENKTRLHKLIPEIKAFSSHSKANESVASPSATSVAPLHNNSGVSGAEEKWTTTTVQPDATLQPRKVSIRAGSMIGQRGLFSRGGSSGSFVGRSVLPSGINNGNTVVPTASREFDPKEFFDTVARALVSPSEPLYLFFFLVLLLFLLVAGQVFGVFLVWGTTLLLLYIIAMHQSQESRAEFFKEFVNFFPRENVTTKILKQQE